MDRLCRLIGPGMEMIAKGIGHQAFVLLCRVTSYCEMIGKYADRYLGTGKSGHYFKHVLKPVIRDREFQTVKIPSTDYATEFETVSTTSA